MFEKKLLCTMGQIVVFYPAAGQGLTNKLVEKARSLGGYMFFFDGRM